MLSSRTGSWAVGWGVTFAVSVVGAFLFFIGWRCPACGKWPGDVHVHFNYCGRCAIPLAAGVDPPREQTSAQAEWVVATLRRRAWWVWGTALLVFGGGALLAGPLYRAGLGPVGLGVFLLGNIGWSILVSRLWRCPECEARLESYDVMRFCTRCGVPHDRKGLERARLQS